MSKWISIKNRWPYEYGYYLARNGRDIQQVSYSKYNKSGALWEFANGEPMLNNWKFSHWRSLSPDESLHDKMEVSNTSGNERSYISDIDWTAGTEALLFQAKYNPNFWAEVNEAIIRTFDNAVVFPPIENAFDNAVVFQAPGHRPQARTLKRIRRSEANSAI